MAMTDKALCILHANCLGDMLKPLLESVPAFANRFTIHRYTNYTREEIAAQDSSHCALYLYQFLGGKWGELSTEQMLSSLPATCTTIEIPNFLFKGYWPFWASGYEVIAFKDTVLEELLAQGLSASEVLHIYLKGHPSVLGDIPSLAQKAIEEVLLREKGTPITYGQIRAEYWQKEQLFITITHPGARLVFYLAERILQLFGLGLLPESSKAAYVCPFDDFWQPIHPAVGEALCLPFASARRRYRIFKNWMTHREYVSCYLACRENGEKDLLAMLSNLPEGYTPA